MSYSGNVQEIIYFASIIYYIDKTPSATVGMSLELCKLKIRICNYICIFTQLCSINYLKIYEECTRKHLQRPFMIDYQDLCTNECDINRTFIIKVYRD